MFAVICLRSSKLIMLFIMTASHHNSHLTVSVSTGSTVLSLAQLNKQGIRFHAGAASSHARAAIIMACSIANWKHYSAVTANSRGLSNWLFNKQVVRSFSPKPHSVWVSAPLTSPSNPEPQPPNMSCILEKINKKKAASIYVEGLRQSENCLRHSVSGLKSS